MAIGDAVAQFMGTATTNRQPSSGVEEQITAIVKSALTDGISLYNGSVELPIMDAGIDTAQIESANVGATFNAMNCAILITNTNYMRKPGTTDTVYIGGVQTNV
jgi:hypothetical protein